MPQENILQRLAKQRLAEKTRSMTSDNESLYDFIVRINPQYEKPQHIASLIELLQQVETGPRRLCFSMPPRHAKTESIAHFIAQYLVRHPERTVGYCSYSSTLAENKSKVIRRYFLEAGGELDQTSKSAAHWQTTKGGGLIAVGTGGAIVGLGVHLLVIDDPHRSRAEVESSTIRNNTYEWFTSTTRTRLEPGGSIVINHTRWHPEDLIGQLVKANPDMWTYINLPAISDSGEALWPTRWPLLELEEIRKTIGEYEFASQYQGQPRPRGGAVFKDVQYYEQLPGITAMCIGIDLAYTNKTYSDYSVAVVLAKCADGKYYVLDVVRKQCEPTDFVHELDSLRTIYGCNNIFWFISGVEKGIIPFLKNNKLHVRAEVTNKDKFTRSIDVAAAWNRGDVLLPKDAKWVDSFVGEVLSFTGVSDSHDDIVDALSAAYHIVGTKKTVRFLGQRSLGFL